MNHDSTSKICKRTKNDPRENRKRLNKEKKIKKKQQHYLVNSRTGLLKKNIKNI